MQTLIIKHVDGVTPVKATAFVMQREVILEWKFEGIIFETTITKERYNELLKKQTN